MNIFDPMIQLELLKAVKAKHSTVILDGEPFYLKYDNTITDRAPEGTVHFSPADTHKLVPRGYLDIHKLKTELEIR